MHRPADTWRPDVQGLRAVAVGLVVLAHAGLPGLGGGFVGVDVFFVVSGFLITGLLLRETEASGRVDLLAFYARRARRILPAATVVLVVVTAYVAATQPIVQVRATASDATWSSLFLANVHFASERVDYFSSDLPSPFQHFWSLAVEEQFYLVWPVLLALAAARLERRRLPLVIAATVLVSLAWSVHVTAQDPVSAYFSSPARAYELGLGALLAATQPSWSRLAPRTRAAGGLVGLLALGAAAVVLRETTPFPGVAALLPCLATAAVLVAGDGHRPGVGRLLALAPLRYLGDISYSLYLWHWPVLRLGERELAGWSVVPRTGLLLAITLALAVVGHHLVERPFLRRGGRRTRSRRRYGLVLWPAAVASVLATTTLAHAHADEVVAAQRERADAYFTQHPEALDRPEAATIEEDVAAAVARARDGAELPPDIDLRRLSRDVWRYRYECSAWWDMTSHELCPVGDTAADRLVVVYGDSHAGMWLPALDRLGRRHHFRVLPLLKHACAPFDVPQTLGVSAFPACPEFRVWAREQIAELHPDAVVLGYRGLLSVDAPEGRSDDEVWEDGVRRTVTDLAGLVPVVTVISDVPSRPTEAAACLSAQRATQRTCLAPEEGPEVHSNTLTRRAIAGTGADFVDVDGLVCQDGQCPLVVGPDVVYFDADHITMSWGRLVADRFGELLGAGFPGRAS